MSDRKWKIKNSFPYLSLHTSITLIKLGHIRKKNKSEEKIFYKCKLDKNKSNK